MSDQSQEPREDNVVEEGTQSIPTRTEQEALHPERKDLGEVEYEAYIKTQIRMRLFSAFNYLSIQLYIIIVYSSIFLTDYFILWLIGTLLKSEIENYEIVGIWFDRLKIGLAILLMIFAIVHGLLSTISQIQLDWQMFRKEGPSWKKQDLSQK